MNKVCVLGLGYIGLPTASVLATNGFDVLGVDVSEAVVNTVNRGDIHIEEPGLQTVVRAATVSGNLRAAREPEAADVFIIAVPTPLTPQKTADMSFVTQAAESIVPHVQPGSLVILESTSPPGTCRKLLRPILEQSGHRVPEDIALAHCPERVLPGKILRELITNDRIVGGFDTPSAARARDLYARFVEGQIFLTDVTTAEMVKLLENTYRDVNIALANEVAIICERLGIDYWEAARLANRHPRVNVLSAGPGVGGHCISVDPWFLVELDPGESRLIRLARDRNDTMPRYVADRVAELLQGIEAPRVAVLGVAYKGNVDDTRESPALEVVRLLAARAVALGVYDPHVRHAPFDLVSLDTALEGADLLLLLTDHNEFKYLNPKQVAKQMRSRYVLDTRHALDASDWAQAGFQMSVLGAGAPREE